MVDPKQRKAVTPSGLVAKSTSYTQRDIPWTDWSDAEFLAYVELHSKTERALFSAKMLWRLAKLANTAFEGDLCATDHVPFPYEEAKPFIEAARALLEPPT